MSFLSKKYDFIVIGGGIIGLSSAMQILEKFPQKGIIGHYLKYPNENIIEKIHKFLLFTVGA